MRDEITSKQQPKGDEAQERTSSNPHPSRSLEPRARGYGIGGGYEKPYRKRPRPADEQSESYGPMPHSGYYGAGAESERFERGQAGYNRELSWYTSQYGERTSGQPDKT
ncbi:MAG: hypothetical protein AABN33_16440 [Acidobacteriota bacterium]